MENNAIEPLKSLCEARSEAFNSAGNLDLPLTERKEYSRTAEELGALIDQLATHKIDENSLALSEQSEVKSITNEISSKSREIDWSHPVAQSANSNLGHLSKMIDAGKKLLALVQANE